MIRRFLLVIVMVLGTSLVSQAGMLAGGAIYGSDYQRYATVRIFNAGSTPVTVLSKEIFQFPNVAVPLSIDYFPGNVLNPGEQSAFQANIDHTQQTSARIKVEGSAESVCAVLEIRNGDWVTVVNTPLRPIR